MGWNKESLPHVQKLSRNQCKSYSLPIPVNLSGLLICLTIESKILLQGAFKLWRLTNGGLDASPGSESEFPVGDWQKLEGMNTLFLGTAK